MGLTNSSTGSSILENELKIVQRISKDDKIIALAGNPNVGKSTVFNQLTGLNQHTGNWPGKTVTNAQGKCSHKNKNYIMVDLPGTYSLMANSVEEEIARNFICFGKPDATVIVTDATCLERNLNLVLQTIEITHNVVMCVNLMDEAKRKKIQVNLDQLSKILGIPVIPTSANTGEGLENLMDAVHNITQKSNTSSPIKIHYDSTIEHAISLLEPSIKAVFENQVNSRWIALRLLENDTSLIESFNKYLNYDITQLKPIALKLKVAKIYLENAGINENLLRDKIVSHLVYTSEELTNKVITYRSEQYNILDRRIDRVLTSRLFGIPIMLGLLGLVFWITITGANYPSGALANMFFTFEGYLSQFFLNTLHTPHWIHGILVLGVYRTLGWVISVMLPPMAIFFPLFTLLEDLGYLPRVAFNLDNFFKKACAHGKQALTMCMGFGCNAAGVIGCRIIESPRERLIAILTNNFVPCNGRFPTLIAIITMFFVGVNPGSFGSILSTLILTAVIVLGIVMTLLISRILSKTILKGLPSSFTLELPPYRKPQIKQVLIRSVLDRTLFVLGRAIVVAAPVGLIIWLLANIYVGDISILTHCANFLDPFASLIGMDGYILMAFILGFPANEIVVPIIIMSYMATGSMLELESLSQLKELFINNGWTWLTAVCVMLFSLMHFPCGTTILTIKKETQSFKWALVSFIIPTVTGLFICFIVANTARLFGLV